MFKGTKLDKWVLTWKENGTEHERKFDSFEALADFASILPSNCTKLNDRKENK